MGLAWCLLLLLGGFLGLSFAHPAEQDVENHSEHELRLVLRWVRACREQTARSLRQLERRTWLEAIFEISNIPCGGLVVYL